MRRGWAKPFKKTRKSFPLRSLTVLPFSLAVQFHGLESERPVSLLRCAGTPVAAAEQFVGRWAVTVGAAERRGPRMVRLRQARLDGGLERGDAPFGRVIRFWKGERLLATMWLWRPAKQGDFSKAETGLFEGLYPHFKAALRRLEKLHRDRLARAAAEQWLNRIPLAVLLLDWELNVIYSNAPARESCALWNCTGKTDAKRRRQHGFRVPSTLLKECGQWKQRWYEEMLEREKSSCHRRTVRHPDLPQLRADVHLICRETGNTAKPVFRIQFEGDDRTRGEGSDGRFPANLAQLVRLTARERELVRLVCEGDSNAEIADRLFLSVGTVKKELNTVFQKLGVSSRGRLIVLAQSGAEDGKHENETIRRLR